jgi:Uma2 family endonuclease
VTTVTNPQQMRADDSGPWTVDDLPALPEATRYEIFDGSLLVTPSPATPHVNTVYRLRRSLDRQAPARLAVVTEGWGVYANERSYYVPDLLIADEALLVSGSKGISPKDVLLAVEVVSPSNPGNDLLLKRIVYADLGIPEYWIVDGRTPALTVLRLADRGYREVAACRPGERWSAETPFTLSVDPAEIF